MTIKTIVFRCQLDGLSLSGVEEVKALLEQVGASIQTIHPDALIDPSVEIGEVPKSMQVGAAATSAGGADGYLEVKRAKTGKTEYLYAPGDGTSVAITKEQYDAAHAGPEMQAQLEHARQVSAKQHN